MSKLIVEDIRSKNMFDKNAVVAGALNADGSIEQMEGIYTSDFIQVEPNKTYYKGQSDSIRFKFYDANKTAISSTYTDIQNAGNAQAFTVPYTAYYIRFSVTQNYLSTLQVEQGTQATEYCRHFDFNTIEEVVKNENGTAIKYSNGIMKCFGNIIIQAVNFDRAYGNMYIESIGYRNFSFSEKFVDDSYFLNLYPKNFGGGVGGVCGAAYNTQTATYWLWHSSAYDFSEKTLEISYEAIGRWK